MKWYEKLKRRSESNSMLKQPRRRQKSRRKTREEELLETAFLLPSYDKPIQYESNADDEPPGRRRQRRALGRRWGYRIATGRRMGRRARRAGLWM